MTNTKYFVTKQKNFFYCFDAHLEQTTYYLRRLPEFFLMTKCFVFLISFLEET